MFAGRLGRACDKLTLHRAVSGLLLGLEDDSVVGKVLVLAIGIGCEPRGSRVRRSIGFHSCSTGWLDEIGAEIVLIPLSDSFCLLAELNQAIAPFGFLLAGGCRFKLRRLSL